MFKAIKIILIFFAVCLFFSATTAEESQAAYYARGILQSENVLSGADITNINNFVVVADIPASTSVSVSFSQDRSLYYSASGTKGAWTELSDGANTIDLSALGWSGASFYYKIRLEAWPDPAVQPKLKEVKVVYEGSSAPPVPSSNYNWTGSFVSADLLASTSEPLTGYEWFAYEISYLPYGATVKAQFSTDGTHWYSSSGQLWGWDTLSAGNHLSPPNAIDLSSLGWGGQTSFYYKIKFTSGYDNLYSPVLKRAGFTTYSAYMSGGAKGAGPVGYWNFDEGQGEIIHDASGRGYAGSLSAGSGGSNTEASQIWTPAGRFGAALEFDGVDDYASVGNINATGTSFALWLKADNLNRGVIDFDGGTHTITLDNGRLKANGFSNTTIFVNGLVGDSVSNNTWNHILVIISSRVSAEAVTIGRVGSSYFSGQVDEARLYHYVLTQKQIEMDYNGGAAARF